MTTKPGTAEPTRASPIVGGVAGAFLGALLRFLVAISFVVYAENWGHSGKILNDPDGNAYWFTTMSAAIGFVIGGIAGSTCRPILGSILGALSSAGFCYCLFLVPMGMMIRFPDSDAAMNEICIAWFAMVIAGAVAGGIGAAVGRRGGFGEPRSTPRGMASQGKS